METGFIFYREKPELFNQYWQEYFENNQVSPQYSLISLEYFRAYSIKFASDQSFVYLKNRKPVALAFLPIEKIDGEKSITSGGSFTLAPIFIQQDSIEEEVMAQLDTIARTEKVAKIMFRIDPLERQYHYNFFLHYDYLDASILGYLVDCKNITLRRNHQRAIRKITVDTNFSLYLMDKNNSDYQIHEEYRQLHHKAAGKITRPKASFDLQFKMLEAGQVILVGLKYRERFVAFTYFGYNADKALSFSASDDPEFDHWPLYHIINAEAFKYFQRCGVKAVDMGQPLNRSPQILYYPDDKQKNIALFKTGFGGNFVNNFRAVKYFSQPIFRQDLADFIRIYETSIKE